MNMPGAQTKEVGRKQTNDSERIASLTVKGTFHVMTKLQVNVNRGHEVQNRYTFNIWL